MCTCGIYKITSPSSKIYIGQSINIESRFKYYKTMYAKKQLKLDRSLRKYGIDLHIFEVIEQCDELHLNERERYWQEFYDVLGKKGLNCRYTNTFDKSGKLSKESCKKIAESHKGKTHSKERVEKRTKTLISNFKDYKSPLRKGVIYQYSLDGAFIKEWECAFEVWKSINIRRSSLSICLNSKKLKIGYGYYWSYKKYDNIKTLS